MLISSYVSICSSVFSGHMNIACVGSEFRRGHAVWGLTDTKK